MIVFIITYLIINRPSKAFWVPVRQRFAEKFRRPHHQFHATGKSNAAQ